MSIRVHRTKYVMNATMRNNHSQPGWTIVASTSLTYAYTRPYARTPFVKEEPMDVYVDEFGAAFIEFKLASGLKEYMRSDGDGPWHELRPGLTYYKDGKPYLRVGAA